MAKKVVKKVRPKPQRKAASKKPASKKKAPPRRPAPRRAPPRRTASKPAAAGRPAKLSSGAGGPGGIPLPILDLLEAVLDELGAASKPRTAAKLRALDDTRFREVVDGVDWKANDGPALVKEFQAVSHKTLASREESTAADRIAAQLGMTRQERAARGAAGASVKFTPRTRGVMESLFCSPRWEAPLMWLACCCGCCRCWPVSREWPFCRICCRCGWIRVTKAGAGAVKANWLDFTGGVSVSAGVPTGRAVVDIAGIPGPAGATGPAGPAGSDGRDGMDGQNGADGQDGAPGPTGATGPAGPAGSDGQNGADGQDGAPGATGPMGPQGPAGPAGPGIVYDDPAGHGPGSYYLKVTATGSLVYQKGMTPTTLVP
jgi:hypothetical protein